MPNFIKLSFFRAVLVALGLAAGTACAQEYSTGWQADMDLVSAGAASSIVLHFRCAGQDAGNAATAHAIERIEAIIQSMAGAAPQPAVREYVFDATNLKLSALTQSSQGQACGQMKRLRDIAQGTGFPLP